MLTIRCARQSRPSLYSLPLYFFQSISSSAAAASAATAKHLIFASYLSRPASASSTPQSPPPPPPPQASDILVPFKQWFLSRKNPLLDQIFEILRIQDGAAAEAAIYRLNLRLSESLVLDVLKYGMLEKDLLSCLKFFDWAGRQNGFHHTTATYHSIFRNLSKAKLMSLMLEFLDDYREQRYVHQVKFHSILVIGYAIAGEPDRALQIFGKMRFQGLDLDNFSYHVFLNSLVEHGYFDVVDVIANQIRLRGLESGLTHSILLKSFCKKNEFDRAEEYLRRLMAGNVNGKVGVNGVMVATFVHALCKDKQFERAGQLVEEVEKMGNVRLEQTYGVWIKDLVQAGKIDGALEFLRGKKELDGYVPDVFRYNSLVGRLLRDNRLHEVFDMLTEMKDHDILPDQFTMNATLCFFCKVGMLDVAMELYNSRAEFGLTVNAMAYNYLINCLFGDSSVDNAYPVLRNAVNLGYLPGKRTFSIVADALCREKKLDKMMELVIVAWEKNFVLSQSIYNKFITALCESKKLEDGYLLYGQLNRLNKVPDRNAYASLINGFYKAGRGDIAASLLIEMQVKGHQPDKKLYRSVIYCVCQMDDPESQFFRLLEMQMSRGEFTCEHFNCFINGAGHAGKYHLARQVYVIMERIGIQPSTRSDMLVLQSYLKNDKIADALIFFRDVYKRRGLRKKLWQTMVVGLCKAGKQDLAFDIFWEIRANQLEPCIECYEGLVMLLCTRKQYSMAIEIIDDLLLIGRRMSSFIGNVLLCHSFNSRELFYAWTKSRNPDNLTSQSWNLGKLMEVFSDSGRGEQDIANMEELIQRCFPLDTFTYNMLLQRLSMSGINLAWEYLNRLHKKGHEPNRWSYHVVVKALLKLGRTAEARKVMEEMFRKGFDLTESTKLFL